MSVLENYANPNRYYHNFQHIGNMLEWLDLHFLDQIGEHQAKWLRAAITYHDVIYVPGSHTNELMSANAFRDEAHIDRYTQSEIVEVQRLILETINHQPRKGDRMACIIVDLDLAGLGTDEYHDNSVRIRKEFEGISDEYWRAGRISWLKSFLARPTIFHTETGKRIWESPARHNMQLELEYLEKLSAKSV